MTQGGNLGASISLSKDNAMVTNGSCSLLYDSPQRTQRTLEMPRETQPFEQDFLLVSETEMRVRQATQYAQLDQAILLTQHEEIWEWEASTMDGERPSNKYLDEEYVTVWDTMLERL
jgi:hypothetical protein